MNWTERDIRISIEQKEYIDTALIPISIVSWGERAIEHSNMRDYLSKLCRLIEREYRGRIILFPILSFPINYQIEIMMSSIENQLIDEGIKQIYYLTCEWEVNLHNLICVPQIPIQEMDDKNQLIILQSQKELIIKRMKNGWLIK